MKWNRGSVELDDRRKMRPREMKVKFKSKKSLGTSAIGNFQ